MSAMIRHCWAYVVFAVVMGVTTTLTVAQPGPVVQSTGVPNSVEGIKEEGGTSRLSPDDAKTTWINEAGRGPFRLPSPPANALYLEQCTLANIGPAGSTEIDQIEFTIRNVGPEQPIVAEIRFWDDLDQLAPVGTSVVSNQIGTLYAFDFGVLAANSTLYTAPLRLSPPVTLSDNNICVEIAYRNSPGGPYATECTTHFFAGNDIAPTPQVGGSINGWYMDATTPNDILESNEYFDFAAPNDSADFRMHLRGTNIVTLDVGFSGDVIIDRFFASVENRGARPVFIQSFQLIAQEDSGHQCQISKTLSQPFRLNPGRAKAKTFRIPADCVWSDISSFSASIYDPAGQLIASDSYANSVGVLVKCTTWTDGAGTDHHDTDFTVTNSSNSSVVVAKVRYKRIAGGVVTEEVTDTLVAPRQIDPEGVEEFTRDFGGEEAVGEIVEIEVLDGSCNVIGKGHGVRQAVDCP